MEAVPVERKILEALSRAEIGNLPRGMQLEVADGILSSLRNEGLLSSHRLRIAESTGVPRMLTVAWSATLPCPTRELSVAVADLTTEHWELTSVMES